MIREIKSMDELKRLLTYITSDYRVVYSGDRISIIHPKFKDMYYYNIGESEKEIIKDVMSELKHKKVKVEVVRGFF